MLGELFLLISFGSVARQSHSWGQRNIRCCRDCKISLLAFPIEFEYGFKMDMLLRYDFGVLIQDKDRGLK
jgi:hypothetical protein